MDDKSKVLVSRIIEYRKNPHHINPMSERFQEFLSEVIDYFTQSEWMEIDSAPKDGTRIIGFDFHQWGQEKICTTYCGNSGKWVFEAEIEAVGWEDYRHAYWEPTHWQPLPEPPE